MPNSSHSPTVDDLLGARAALAPNVPSVVAVQRLGNILRAFSSTATSRRAWCVAALEWLDAAAHLHPRDVRPLSRQVREVASHLAGELPELTVLDSGNVPAPHATIRARSEGARTEPGETEPHDEAWDSPEIWALWAFTNALVCINAPESGVLEDVILADSLASAVEYVGALPWKGADTSAQQVISLARSASASTPPQRFIRTESQRKQSDESVEKDTCSHVCNLMRASLRYIDETDSKIDPIDSERPRMETACDSEKRISGWLGQTSIDIKKTSKKIIVNSLSRMISFTAFVISLTVTRLLFRNELRFPTPDSPNVEPWQWDADFGISESFVSTSSLGLIAVIATIGVAFAVAPPTSGDRPQAAAWTWHGAGTAVARLCGGIAFIVSSLIFVQTWLTSETEGRSWVAASVSLIIGGLSVYLSSAIASWHDTTVYGQWAQRQESARISLRIIRAKRYVTSTTGGERRSMRKSWVKTYGFTVAPFIVLEVAVLIALGQQAPNTATLWDWIPVIPILGVLLVFHSLPALSALASLGYMYQIDTTGATRLKNFLAAVPTLAVAALYGALLAQAVSSGPPDVISRIILLGGLPLSIVWAGVIGYVGWRSAFIAIYDDAARKIIVKPLSQVSRYGIPEGAQSAQVCDGHCAANLR